MSSTAIGVRYPRGLGRLDPVDAFSQSVRRRIGTAWGLLFFNTLTYMPGYSGLDLPSKVGKGLAQAALPLAIVLLLTVNPRLKVRPNIFLCIVFVLVTETVLTGVQGFHLGTMFRTFRLAEYLAALWLLTPWWGRQDMMLLKFHLRCLWGTLASVLVGLVVFPGHAFSFDNRLTGAIWPMMPTQIAQYAAVTIGLMTVLWLGRRLSGRAVLAGIPIAGLILVLTHTRTALAAGAAGILIASLSLFAVNARVRKFFIAGAVTVSAAVVTAAGFITTWLDRGENTAGLASLSGRTNFWSLVLNLPRTRFQEIFGFGLSNASINGLPIDSNWLASYMQEGLMGVVVCAAMVVFLALAAVFHDSRTRRALALFLVVYCLVASFTEDAFTDVSTYLLHLVVAASLLG